MFIDWLEGDAVDCKKLSDWTMPGVGSEVTGVVSSMRVVCGSFSNSGFSVFSGS